MSDPIEHLAAQDESEHTVSRKRHDALVASQDAEILRLRGALADLCDAWDREHGGKHRGNITKAVTAARAALSSPAPQDAVIVPRELLTDLYNVVSSTFGADCMFAHQLRALLGAPTPSKE